MWTALLSIHVVSGSLALLTGPVALAAPKRHGWHPRAGTWYLALAAVLCASAVGLAILRPAVWWLGVVAAATLAAALGGRALRRRQRPGWLPGHVALMCGSYLSLLTALLVVNLGLGNPVGWVLPTAVGSPLIGWRAYLAAARPIGAGRE